MQKNTELGANRTGVDMSPLDSQQLKDIAEQTPADVAGDIHAFEEAHKDFIVNAESLGSVPLPSTVKGTANAALKKASGTHMEVLIDKLGERIAFERTGVRLYDALLSKVRATPTAAPGLLELLEEFREEEAQHFDIAVQAMQSLGADPTAQTPCADVAGVAAAGIMQVLSDPRTSISQSLNVLLTAELTDNASWELLIELAQQAGQDSQMIQNFQHALHEEQKHLATIKEWFRKDMINQLT